MPPKAPDLGSRSAKPARKTNRRPPTSKPTSKRPRTDGSACRTHVLDSDGEEANFEVPTPRTKRTKLPSTLQAPARLDTDSSDDEPLLHRVVRQKLRRIKDSQKIDSSAGSRKTSTAQESSSLAPAAGSKTPHTFNPAPTSSLHDFDENIDGTEDLTYATVTPSPSHDSVYGKKVNLTSAFQSVSSAAKSSHRIPNPFEPNYSSHRRVPTPDRLFTNMRLKDVNKLLLSMGKARPDEAARTSRSKKGESGKRKKRRTQERPVKEHAEMSEDVIMADDDGDDGFDGIDVHAGGTDEEGDSSDGTLGGDCEDGYAASPAAAKRMRMGDQAQRHLNPLAAEPSTSTPTIPHKASEPQQSRVGRTARSTPATDIVDLTKDVPAYAPPISPRNESLSLADQLFPKSPSPPPSSERPETTIERESAFLKGFTTQWWPGGKTLPTATHSVNAALPPHTPKFTEAEGTQRLRSLSAQGKLAIRHDMVYHPDQDPGADAPRPSPLKGGAHASPSQRLVRELRRAELSPQMSLFGKIAEARYRALEMKLYSAVEVERTLFKNGKEEEALWRCVEVLNQWMAEGAGFSLKEVSAAFVYLAKQGKVLLKGDAVRLVSLE